MTSQNAGQIIEEKVSRKLKERPEISKKIGVCVAVELGGEGGGRWIIDCSKEPAEIKRDASAHAVTTVSMDAGVFEKMANGELDPQTAFLTGKVKIDGNLGVAIKLGDLLS